MVAAASIAPARGRSGFNRAHLNLLWFCAKSPLRLASGQGEFTVKPFPGVVSFGQSESFIDVVIRYGVEIGKQLVSQILVRILALAHVPENDEAALLGKWHGRLPRKLQVETPPALDVPQMPLLSVRSACEP
jgi:hypothetical protein